MPQACGENIHLNGFCVLLDTNLQQLQRIPAAQPGMAITGGVGMEGRVGDLLAWLTMGMSLCVCPPTPKECPKRSSDVVLLIDGSGSIDNYDFSTMKTFIAEVMKRFKDTDTQVQPTQALAGTPRSLAGTPRMVVGEGVSPQRGGLSPLTLREAPRHG